MEWWAMFNLVEPTGLGANMGEVLYDGVGNSTITGNLHCNKLLLSNYHVVHISGDVTILIDEELKVSNYARIELMPGATLKLYIKAYATVQDYGAINPDTANPFAVTIYNLGIKIFEVKNQSTLCAKMFSSDMVLKLQDGSDFYGFFVGKSLHLQNNAGFHFANGSGLEPPTPPYD